MRESHGQTPAETFTPEQTRAMEWLSGISDLEKSPLITVDDMRELLVATRGNFPGDESGETAFLSTVADGLRGSMYPGVYLELLPQESAQKVVDDLAARNARAAKMVKKPQDKEKIFESSSIFAQELPDDLRERYATSLKQSMNRKNNNALRGYEKGKRYSPGVLRRMGSKVMSIAGIPLRPIKSAVIERELHGEFKNRTGMGYVRSTLRHGIRHTRLQRSFGTDWRHVSESDAPHFSHKTEHHLRHALLHHYGQWAWPSAEPTEIGSRMKSNSKDIATFLGRATKQGGVDLPENFEIPQSLPKQNQMILDLGRLAGNELAAAFGALHECGSELRT
jgi:hypothetical protein